MAGKGSTTQTPAPAATAQTTGYVTPIIPTTAPPAGESVWDQWVRANQNNGVGGSWLASLYGIHGAWTPPPTTPTPPVTPPATPTPPVTPLHQPPSQWWRDPGSQSGIPQWWQHMGNQNGQTPPPSQDRWQQWLGLLQRQPLNSANINDNTMGPAPGHGLGYANGGAVTGYARGGDIVTDPNFGTSRPVPTYAQPSAGMDPRMVVIAEAEDALTGQSQDPDGALSRFTDMFGDSALHQLRSQVARGQTMRSLQADQSGRMVAGPPSKADTVPAVVDGAKPVALSTGEYVLPAQAVVGAGNGDQAQGAARLDELSRMLTRR